MSEMEKPADQRELKDSGKRQNFGTGAVRDITTDKGTYYLLQVHAVSRMAEAAGGWPHLPPHAIFRDARVLEKGSIKYKARNWELGMPLHRLIDSALRHWFQVKEGRTDEDHPAQALWNVMSLIETEYWIRTGQLPKELNDLPQKRDGVVQHYDLKASTLDILWGEGAYHLFAVLAGQDNEDHMALAALSIARYIELQHHNENAKGKVSQ